MRTFSILKALISKLTRAVITLMLLTASYSSYAQIPTQCGTPNCTSNDVRITRATISTSATNPDAYSYCNVGSTVSGLYLHLIVSTNTKRIGCYISATLNIVTGPNDTTRVPIGNCFYGEHLTGDNNDLEIALSSVPCGTEAFLTNVFTAWGTGNTDFCGGLPGIACPATPSKCRFVPGEIIMVQTTPCALPSFSQQPASDTKCAGDQISFTSKFTWSTGTVTTSYKWQISTDGGTTYSDLTISNPYSETNSLTSGVKTTTLTINPIASSMNSNKYKVLVTNTTSDTNIPVNERSCPASSSAATLTVNTKPVITDQPDNVTKCAGQSTSFTAAYTDGTPAAGKQWRMSTDGGTTWSFVQASSIYSGVTSNTLNISNVTGLNGYKYRLGLKSGVCDSVYTDAATLTVNTSPVVTDDPDNVTKCAGEAASFTAAYTDGTPAAGKQWRVSSDGGTTWSFVVASSIYSGVTSNTLNISNVTGLNGYKYRLGLKSGVCDSVYSAAATLTVNTKPVITDQPDNVSKCDGESASFTVAYTEGSPAAGIKWRMSTDGGTTWSFVPESSPYSGATSATLNISNVTGLNGYKYRLGLKSGVCDSVYSDAATLTVNTKPVITDQPDDVTKCAGQSASFSVAYTEGSPAAGIKWRMSTNGGSTWSDVPNASPYSGVTTNTLNISDVTGLNGYKYRLGLKSGVCDSVYSSAATLTVGEIPGKPDFTITQPGLCGPSTGTLTICQSVSGYNYTVGSETKAGTGSTLSFTGLLAGSNPSLSIVNTVGTCTSASYSCSDAVTSCTSSASRVFQQQQQEPDGMIEQVTIVTKEEPVVKSQAVIANEPVIKGIKVTAYPNPYNDKVRFVVNTDQAGQANLELVNILGQKIATVYNGHLLAGSRSFEVTLPMQHRSTVIYILRLNGKQITGKLLQSGY